MSFNKRERFKERKFSFKIKKKKEVKEEKEKDINYENPIKIIAFSPLMFMGLFYNIIHRNYDSYNTKKEPEKKKSLRQVIEDNNDVINDKTITSSIFDNFGRKNDNNKTNFVTNKFSYTYKEEITTDKNLPNKKQSHAFVYEKNNVMDIEKKIFNSFKRKLENMHNEIDIIESEEYLISKYSYDKDMLEEAIKIRKEIENLIKKLDKINERYKLIKENNLIEEPLLLDDKFLIDDIIRYREKISKEEYNNISDNLKLLDDYQYLYKKIDEIEEKTFNIEEQTNNRINELAERDEKYKKARKKFVDLDEVTRTCDSIINKHNKYLEDLYKKVDKIDEKKYIEYKLKGMNGLLSSSLRYIGLLTLTPLRGLFPGIAARTVATRKVVSNIINNIHYEKIEKTKYSLSNYENEINNKIYDINDLEYNIDSTLEDISKLKEEFRDYFLKYNLKEYEVAYRKINKLEKNILSNKDKVYIIKRNLIKNKELNRNALRRVRKLNSQ